MSNIQVLDRVVQILDCFSRERPTLTAHEIHVMTGIPRSTVYRILQALVEFGFCAVDEDARTFRLGARLLYLSSIVLDTWDLRKIALPFMRELAADVGESVTLSVREDRARVCIEQIEASHEIRDIIRVGARTPLVLGASGKLLLAYAPRDVAVSCFPAEKGAAALDQFLRQLDRIREQGFALSLGERVPGSSSVAAPIFNHVGNCVASLTLSGPAFRFSEQTVKKWIPKLLETTQQISRQLGWYAEDNRNAGSVPRAGVKRT